MKSKNTLNVLWLIIAIVIFCLLQSCAYTPPECIAYCEQIEKWATQCKRPKFSQASCREHFRSGEHYNDLSMKCWRMALAWSPNPEAEFNCETTQIPEL